jgi:FkbH-like protein
MPHLPDQQLAGRVKCVVWDLDNTVWDGVLLEDRQVALRAGVIDVIRTLDARGLLHSVASRNDFDAAMRQLRAFRLQEYFLYPQIGWHSKVSSMQAIAKSLNIGLDAVAFVDDDPFEREAMAASLPEVLLVDAHSLPSLLERPEFNPVYVTDDARQRRFMYMAEYQREAAEESFDGPDEAFLATLDLRMTIAPAAVGDLRRVQELTMRTHQLNSTGRTYSYEELEELSHSPRHKLLIAGLDDKCGTYGKIGLALVECCEELWSLKLLLVSCRVISRGAGTILLNYLLTLAREQRVRVQVEFRPTDRNRLMYVSLKFAGFREVQRNADFHVLECDLNRIHALPPYVKVEARV